MKRTIVILLLSLLTLSAQLTTSQTRPRRLGEAMPEPSPSPSPGEMDVVRVETNLVTVPVSVVDREGRYISDLQKEDFQLAEDGIDVAGIVVLKRMSSWKVGRSRAPREIDDPR